VHSILASRLGRIEKAYSLYLRTSRLDLDDYNKEVEEGLHITSMAGTWMSLVQGFGGVRIINDQLHIDSVLPFVCSPKIVPLSQTKLNSTYLPLRYSWNSLSFDE